MPSPAFYTDLGDGRFRSEASTGGPWDPRWQHGGPPLALMAHVSDGVAPFPGQRLARLSIEILRPVPIATLTTTARVVRPGKRIALLEAEAHVEGEPVLRATAWRLLAEPGRSPAAADDRAAAPGPDDPAVSAPGGVAGFPYGDALEWRFIHGSFSTPGPGAVWARSRIPLIDGVPLSPVARVLLMVDSANGISAELDLKRWTYVPVDMTVVMHRHAVGEWVGMDAKTVLDDAGVGMTRAALFDPRGALGNSLQTLYVAPR